jgi:2-polyprenyl-6-methoxyphenol hydroxylase-like FAD-dependent oxidoreductase
MQKWILTAGLVLAVWLGTFGISMAVVGARDDKEPIAYISPSSEAIGLSPNCRFAVESLIASFGQTPPADVLAQLRKGDFDDIFDRYCPKQPN